MVALSCSLSELELGEQLARYRVVGEGAEVLGWGRRRLAIRVAESVPESLVERLVEVERDCCPFFELSWDLWSRCLAISVSERDQEPALDAIGHVLGMVDPAVG
jgi:hypothetical protein